MARHPVYMDPDDVELQSFLWAGSAPGSERRVRQVLGSLDLSV